MHISPRPPTSEGCFVPQHDREIGNDLGAPFGSVQGMHCLSEQCVSPAQLERREHVGSTY